MKSIVLFYYTFNLLVIYSHATKRKMEDADVGDATTRNSKKKRLATEHVEMKDNTAGKAIESTIHTSEINSLF